MNVIRLQQKPSERRYSVMELFAGAGGLALGLEKAGLHCAVLNELNKHACNTLRLNRPQWMVEEGDVRAMNFNSFAKTIDVVTGGFPCQAFSSAGKRLGFEDTRGTLFYRRGDRTYSEGACNAKHVIRYAALEPTKSPLRRSK